MPPIKAVFFDFMGTCLDWHSSVTSALPSSLSASTRSSFALTWRQAYFDENAQRLAISLPPEDFSSTLRKSLDVLLATPEHADLAQHFRTEDREALIEAWYAQPAWPDVEPALRHLRDQLDDHATMVVHANGTTRLQIALARSSGLRGMFDGMFSSQMLGLLKPGVESYRKGLEWVGCAAEEAVMVAAHAYDLRGAKAVGMRTIYVYRWTDDVKEDQKAVKKEGFDEYLSHDMSGLGDAVDRISREP
nr:2-haloalkanoic acid dehalogenase [Quercus suber]